MATPRLALLLTLLCASTATAQIDRYELGRRVRLFERAFAAAPPEHRAKRSVEYAKTAVTSFFAMQFSAAGKALTAGRRALSGQGNPSDAARFAESLHLIPDARLFDTGTRSIGFRIRPFYRVDVAAPEGARLEIRLVQGDTRLAVHRVAIEDSRLEDTLTWTADLPPGEYALAAALVIGSDEHPISTIPVSLVKDLAPRLARVREKLDELDNGTTRYHTIRLARDNLTALQRRRALETDYPANAVLAQAEADLREPKRPLQRRVGQHWLSVALPKAGGQRARRVVLRAEIPTGLTADERRPLVLALHGAGGTENLFFDSYGDGRIRGLARSRGWVLVAPRLGLRNTPDLPRLIAQLQKTLPIDPQRVVLIGHSMGAAAAVSEACKAPQAFRGVVAFGGGGRVLRSAALRDLPFLVSIGDADFARQSARGLHRSLEAAGVQTLKFLEHPDIEHLMIVQVGLPDAFTFLDGVLGK